MTGVTRRLPSLLAAAALALAALTPAAALAANPDPPAATTGEVKDLALTSATFTATVDPRGAETTYRFEYGTSDSYGLATAERSAGAGSGAVTVSVPVTGLTSDTSYHVRVVATNPAGVTRGADRSFRTTVPPRPPGVSTGAARTVRADTAGLTGSLDPRGQATTYRFEYGTSTKYGLTTPDASAAWSGSKTITATLGGLAAYTTYHYRLVATNPSGTTRGGDRTLRTLRAPSSIALTATPNPVSWGDRVTLSGQVLGSGVANTSVAVQRTDFPFTKGFWVPRVFTTGGDGRFSTTVGPLWETTQLRLVTRSTNVAASPVATIGVRVRVGVRRQGAARGAVGLTGVIRPAVPQARVSLQRRTLAGAWVPVRRTGTTSLAGNRSRYALRVPRTRRASVVRVVVTPNDGGAHEAGVSRELAVRGRGGR